MREFNLCEPRARVRETYSLSLSLLLSISLAFSSLSFSLARSLVVYARTHRVYTSVAALACVRDACAKCSVGGAHTLRHSDAGHAGREKRHETRVIWECEAVRF